jgi:hypothetical protein
MIPAILAAPLVQGVVGSVVGSVMNCFAPSAPPPATASPTSGSTFTPYLNSATTATAPQFSPSTFSSGTIRASQWNQMGSVDMNSWMKSLQGSHVDATDATGRTISGNVTGVQQLGNTMALNIGGHLVSLSQLNQITWSPSIA